MVFLWFSFDFREFPIGFPLGLPLSYGFSYGFAIVLWVFLWLSYGSRVFHVPSQAEDAPELRLRRNLVPPACRILSDPVGWAKLVAVPTRWCKPEENHGKTMGKPW